MISYFNNDPGFDRGYLRYNDFLQIVMPCDAPDLRADIATRPNIHHPEGRGVIDPMVEGSLALLLEKEIHFNRILEAQK